MESININLTQINVMFLGRKDAINGGVCQGGVEGSANERITLQYWTTAELSN